ncbi:hypothetical protein L1887_02041 [Cichorium endivia]|nr:hypothetical protein L1887_02041 [Cichorium endivia]
MSDSLVRVFKTGRMGCPQAGAWEHAGISPRRRVLPTTIDATAISTSLSTARALAAAPIRTGPTPRVDRRTGYRRSTSDRDASPAPIRFPPDNFKHSLTLFSKSFSSFPSLGTCLLSVSRRVFSLGRNLPPYWGCIPKQPDSQTAPRGATGSGHDGALTLSGAPFQGTWARSAAEDASPDYNSDSEAVRFSSWADPGSLAVTKGILANRTISTGRPISAPDAMCPDKGMHGWGATRCVDAQAGVALGRMALGATCVQKLDGSRDSAIHTKYRILLRSSSMREPRYPLPRVVCDSKEATPNTHTANGTKLDASFSFVVFLGTYRAGVCYGVGLKSMAPQMGQPQK